MATNRYVYLSNSYSSNGDGSTSNPLNWTQFLTELSGGSNIGIITENNYYLSGVRSLNTDSFITLSAINAINFYSWNKNNPAIIYSTEGIYFELETPLFNVTDLLIQAKCSATNNAFLDSAHRILTRNYGTVTIDNCYLKINSIAKFSRLTALLVRNSIVISDGKLEGYSFDDPVLPTDNMTMSLVNNIFDIADFKATTADNMGTIIIDNCTFTSATSAFTNYLESNTTWSNIQSSWTRPSIFSSAVSAINITSQLNYLSASFSTISATGNKFYTNTWMSGRRDGIGALYFPEISGVSISANTAYEPSLNPVSFILSGNNPFIIFSASSATYNFNDGIISAISTNTVQSHTYSASNKYNVSVSIISFNEWYNKNISTYIIVGPFNITPYIFDQNGKNISINFGSTKVLTNLTFAASSDGLAIGNYYWYFDNGTSSTEVSPTEYYLTSGTKNPYITASAAVDSSINISTDIFLKIYLSGVEYFVNITSGYDVCANNSGTSANPFNWNEFKGMVETSGEYADTFRLSGSRVLSASSSNRKVLNIDRRKNFTIRDWDVSAYGPWVLEIKDFTNIDGNTILSAAGCTLKNGIIYNKIFSSLSAGGQITLSNLYNTFIVYQGKYSKIIIDPYFSHYCGDLGGIVPSASSSIIGSTLYISSGNGWKDNFDSNTFSAVSASSYIMEITDSVITNFTTITSSDFSACSVARYNSTFNRKAVDISANFKTCADENCQYEWNSPTDYPFTPNNDLYDKDINYIRTNKKKLRPFNEITIPPNPGKNAPNFLNYETGLFGYYRNQYITSG